MKHYMLIVLVMSLFQSESSGIVAGRTIKIPSAKSKKSKKQKPSVKTTQVFSVPSGNKYLLLDHRLPGIGVEHQGMSEDNLSARANHMIEAQTFVILRDPRAELWAERVTSPKMESIFDSAAKASRFSKSKLEAICFLESGGDPLAKSPAGPSGAMQFAKATALSAGLRIETRTWYEKIPVVRKLTVGSKRKQAAKYRSVRHNEVVLDERLIPEKAIPQAAEYLARMTRDYGEDFAIFAYHCGEGCIQQFMGLAKKYGIEKPTVSKLFFGANPHYKREIYEAIEKHLLRDSSPTYWFRIRRAEQLIALYRSDPNKYKELFRQYQNGENPALRAPARMHLWFFQKKENNFPDFSSLVAARGKELFVPPVDPLFLSFQVRIKHESQMDEEHLAAYTQGTPETLGSLEYIAFETRRLWESGRYRERFVPLTVTSLVKDLAYPGNTGLPMHSKNAFDISYANLPKGEQECLKFILDDLGWDEYISFDNKTEGKDKKIYHIVPAPKHADFFKTIFNEVREHYGK